MPYIKSSEFKVVDGCSITDWNWTVFQGVSVFIFQRPFTEHHADIIRLAKDMGVKVILDYDDDLLNVSEANHTYIMYQENRDSLIDCLQLSDEIWVSTIGILYSFIEFNPEIKVIPNAHHDYLFPVENKRPFDPNGKRVIWRGGGSHEEDVYEVADGLVPIINTNQDWEFNFWGHRFTYMEQRCGDNYICRIGMSLMQYFKALHQLNPQIAIFPLVNNKFNESKSNISFLESVFAGAAFFGNYQLFEFDKPGIMAIKELDVLFKIDRDFLIEEHDKSWNYIQDNLLLSNINKIRTERIIANL